MTRWLRLTLPPIAALIVFAPVLAFGFLEWDDRAYVLDNPVIRDFGADRIGLLLSPGTRTLSAWTPTTLVTYAFELSVLGDGPGGFHATNLLLHALNSLLVTLLLVRLGLGTTGAAIAGILFAVHPLQVEAVAWVSARKELLAAGLSLGSILLYLRRGRGARYGSLALFVLALGAKASAVVVPLLIAVLHLTSRRRPARPEIGLLLTMTAFSGLRSLLEITAQSDATAGAAALGTGPRLAAMIDVLGRYVSRWVWPVDLGAAYPIVPAGAWTIGVALILVGGAVLAWRLSTSSVPLRAGLLWWPVALLPVLNLVPAPYLETDRYQYLPLVGPALWAGFWIEHLAARQRLIALALAALVVIGLGLRSRAFLESWRSNETFYTANLERNPQWWLGRLSMATWHLREGRLELAHAHAVTVRDAVPEFARAHHVLALVAEERGNLRGALALETQAIERNPRLSGAWAHACSLQGRLGRLDAATASCEKALALNPVQPKVARTLALVEIRRGNTADEAGRTEEALRHYDRAVGLDPALRDAYYNRAVALQNSGRYDAALPDYETAAELEPDDPHVFVQLGAVLAHQGRINAARIAYRRAIDLDPSRVDARHALAVLLAAGGRLEDARMELEQLLEVRPELREALLALDQVNRALESPPPDGSAP